ncbi:MAG: response regulator [Spartobacteria bacterium]|nr:response regulator [Spartobacteria bacterium]
MMASCNLFSSIRTKLLLLVLLCFAGLFVSTFLIANYQLKAIIDRSQEELYRGEVARIENSINRNVARLMRTGMEEAYKEAFQASTIDDLASSYYRLSDKTVSPALFRMDGSVVFCPKGRVLADSLKETVLETIGSGDGAFAVYDDTVSRHWLCFKLVSDWDWIVVYDVPYASKYKNLYQFRRIFLLVVGPIALVVLGLVYGILSKFIQPILHLTRASVAFADGGTLLPIKKRGRDEVGILTDAFIDMRTSISEKIEYIARQNEELRIEMLERQRAEEAIRNSERNLEITLNSIGDAVIATDGKSNITRMNPIAENLTQWPQHEALNKPLSEVLHLIDAETRTACPDPVQQIINSGKTVSLQEHTLLISRKGDECRIADSGAPIRNSDGDIVGAVLVFRDVTEEYMLQRRLIQAQKMEAIGTLTGGIAHDFNNIISGVIGPLSMIENRVGKERPENWERFETYFDMIKKNSYRAADMIRQLLMLSHEQDMFFSDTDIIEALRHVIQIAEGSFDKSVVIEAELPEKICRINGNATQIEQVFLNIMINAAHSMTIMRADERDWGGTLHINCQLVSIRQSANDSELHLAEGDYWVVRISDTGVGMKPSMQARIFDPFFSTKDKGSGTGLGLSMAYNLVKQHGGSISVYSEVKTGSCFSIYLPVSNKDTVIQHEKNVTDALTAGSGLVLVVDDEESLRMVAQEMLHDCGYETIEANNGRDALTLFKERKEDIRCVLLDMLMPGISGQETYMQMKAIDPDVNVILTSGFRQDQRAQATMEAGAKAFLQKPYSISQLAEVIHALCG